MANILVPISNGFEEIEAITIIDVCRRANINVTIAGVEDLEITGAHGIKIFSNAKIENISSEDFDMIVLPGGLPNAFTLAENKKVQSLLKDFKSAKPLVDKALSLEKNTDYIWDTKGELEYYLGNYEEAIKAMTNSLNLSKRANSYFYRGLSNIKLGKKTDGCSDLSKAGELGETKAYDEINKNCKLYVVQHSICKRRG